jgi:hypothetical protein
MSLPVAPLLVSAANVESITVTGNKRMVERHAIAEPAVAVGSPDEASRGY